jgi:transcriptional regulator with XRE-family HTH domain
VDDAADAEQAERRRRIRAARMLAVPTAEEIQARHANPKERRGDLGNIGLSQEELGARLVAAGERLGHGLISKLERGVPTHPVASRHMKRIAEACGLPADFFYIDFSRLKGISGQATTQGLPEMPGALATKHLEPPHDAERPQPRPIPKAADEGQGGE